MAAFAALVFFFHHRHYLNHPDWFFSNAETNREYAGTLPREWIQSARVAEGDTTNSSTSIDKLSIVEHFRSTHQIKGAVKEFSIDDYEIAVGFAGPGYTADAFIELEDGSYTLTETSFGAMAIVNDLHKGRDTGPVWSWVIDLTALIMLIVSISGLYMLFKLRNRKATGIVTCLIGSAVVLAIYLIWVP